jgi:hypothetical protein
MFIKKFAFCILLMFIAVANVVGQAPTNDQHKVFIIPRSYALPAVIYQPDCPLRLENYFFINSVEGGGESANYQFRNISAKPIQSYTIAWLTTAGPGGDLSFAAKTPAERINPGGTLPNIEGSGVLVPLTDEIRKKLKMDGPMMAVVCLMVVRVEFDDGTVYSDESTYKALETYFEKVLWNAPHQTSVTPGTK